MSRWTLKRFWGLCNVFQRLLNNSLDFRTYKVSKAIDNIDKVMGQIRLDILHRSIHDSLTAFFICNLTPGTVVGFKYLNFQNVTKVSVKTRGMCYYGGFDVLLTADGEPIGTVSAARGNEWTWQTTELAIPNGISAIYFRMKGYGTLSLAAAKFH